MRVRVCKTLSWAETRSLESRSPTGKLSKSLFQLQDRGVKTRELHNEPYVSEDMPAALDNDQRKGQGPEKGRKTVQKASVLIFMSSDGGLDLEVAKCQEMGHS